MAPLAALFVGLSLSQLISSVFALGNDGTQTVFIAPDPSPTRPFAASGYCESTSYAHIRNDNQEEVFKVQVFPGTQDRSGECLIVTSTPYYYPTTGILTARPSGYIMSVNAWRSATGRVDSCSTLSALTDSTGGTTGTLMTCSASLFGTTTATTRIPLTHTVTYGSQFTQTLTFSLQRDTMTLSGGPAWTAALAAQTTLIASPTATQESSDQDRSMTVILGTLIPIACLSILLGCYFQKRRRRLIKASREGQTQQLLDQSEVQQRQALEMAELRSELRQQELIRMKNEARILELSSPSRTLTPSDNQANSSNSSELAHLRARIAALEAELRSQQDPPPYRPYDA